MKELTLKEMKKNYEVLGKAIAQREKAEAEERKTKLAAEKTAREEEVRLAEKTYRELVSAFLKDYGSYSSTESYTSDDAHIADLICNMFF